MNIAVKEKIARLLGGFFTTDKIVNVFTDANIPTDKTLFAKWRIVLDAFGKMPDQEAGIRKIIGDFCHPLNFADVQIRNNLVKELNAILSFVHLQVWAQTYGAQVISSLGEPLDEKYKSPTEYILEALNFFKNEYNKVKLSGLTYEYCIGEIHPTPDQEYSEEYENSLKAVKRLKEAGVITQYELGVESNDNGYWGIAICKIDESKIVDTNQAPATEAKVQELIHKIEITAMPPVEFKEPQKAKLPKLKIELGDITFNDNDCALIYKSKVCSLPPYKNEHFLCRAMFEFQAKELVDWSMVYEKMTGNTSKDKDKDKRMVYDAFEAINKRVNEIFGVDNLFIWKTRTITRNY